MYLQIDPNIKYISIYHVYTYTKKKQLVLKSDVLLHMRCNINLSECVLHDFLMNRTITILAKSYRPFH